MNFTFTIEPPPDWNWGGLQEDGTWNGMMYLVQHRLVDIGWSFCYTIPFCAIISTLFYYSHYLFDSNRRKRRGSIFQFTNEGDIPNFVHQKSKWEFIQLFGLHWAFALHSLVSNHRSAGFRSYVHIFHRKICSGVSENNSRWIIRSYICLYDNDRFYG